ncbi:MAG: immunity 26/phosphotriesterase HocA family protein [Clostridiales bacterium]|nr:immunity 26/phosphotriesterase HocA family protein [Clostridiales bacterium]
MKQPIEKIILTNEERRYFGLNPIESTWDRVEIKESFAVYFDGDMIRKTISCQTRSDAGYENYLQYTETDNQVQTRGRNIVLPRTDRGKEKKLNYTSIDSMNPTGCVFYVVFGFPKATARLYVGNSRNSITLPIIFPNNISTFAAFRKWLPGYISTCPTDYFDKVERMRNSPHRTVKYYNGDIFRFEIDLEHYGFGLIIGQIRKMQKDALLSKEHIFNDTMCVPLLVRLYLLKTTDKNMSAEQIAAHPLGKTFMMTDDLVIWGAYDIVGSKTLTETDIDFPIQVGRSISAIDFDHVRICWGPGIIVRRNAEDFPKLPFKLMRHGVSQMIHWFEMERAMGNAQAKTGLDESEQIAFRYFDLPLDMTFDVFNRQYGGMTREEYAVYANKAGRGKS